jgi:hypothetical protein
METQSGLARHVDILVYGNTTRTGAAGATHLYSDLHQQENCTENGVKGFGLDLYFV